MAQERILVVEDEPSIAETLRIGLNFLGYDVAAVVDAGITAVEHAKDLRPDLVLMDIGLRGDMDGVEAAAQIRDQVGIPVVFLTAYADGATLQRAKSSDPFGFVTKPYSMNDLRSAVEIAISRHRLSTAAHRQTSVSTALAELAAALLSSASLEDIAHLVLQHARNLTGSESGFVGYVDVETGHVTCPALGGDVWDACPVEGRTTALVEISGLWGWVLEHREPLLTNSPGGDPRSAGTPPGHAPIQRLLAVPATVGDTLVGLVTLANANHDYTEEDLETAGHLADLYAIAAQRQQTEEAERKLSQGLVEEVEKRKEGEQALQVSRDKLDYLLRRFVPASLAQQLIEEHHLPTLGGQRRTVTVLFADVRGYTSLAEVLEPEKLMALLNRHFALIGDAIRSHGGTISRYAGDLVVAVFNAPDEQPDHALRAVRAGMHVRTALDEAGKKPAEGDEWPIAMQFGVGINTGPAVVGYLGFEDRFDYTVIGDAVNVASRLSTVAHSGEVLLGPATFEAIRGRLRTRSLGPMQLKGKSEALTIYEALGEMPSKNTTD